MRSLPLNLGSSYAVWKSVPLAHALCQHFGCTFNLNSAVQGNCMEFLAAFSKPLSACVKMLYANVPAMDLEVSRRFATWLAHHLTNFDCVWPWAKWSNVLSAPPSDPQR